MGKFLLGIKKWSQKENSKWLKAQSVTFDIDKNLINDKSFIAKFTPQRIDHNENSIESKSKIEKLEIL